MKKLMKKCFIFFIIITIVLSYNSLMALKAKAEGSTSNRSPEFYGTTEITIKKGEELNIKNSYFRILAKDAEDGNITKNIKVKSNNVNTSKVGNYTIKYEVTDSDGNNTEISVPVHIVENGNTVIVRKIYGYLDDDKAYTNMDKTGFNRGNKQDVQTLGLYLPADGSFQIEGIDDDSAGLEINLLNDNELKESRSNFIEEPIPLEDKDAELFNKISITVLDTNPIVRQGDAIEVKSNVKVNYKIKDSDDDYTPLEGYNEISYASVPFIKTPQKIKSASVKITLNDTVKPLDYFTYGDTWDASKITNDFAVLDGSRVTFLVPKVDFNDLGKSKKASNQVEYPNDTFNSFEDILRYYDGLIEQYDKWVGYDYNAENDLDKNYKSKFLIKANVNGAGFAYYSTGREVAMNTYSIEVLLHNSGNGWTTLHEIGHGYQGNLPARNLPIIEVSNNILAHYYQKKNLKGDWFGNVADFEQGVIKDVDDNLKNGKSFLNSADVDELTVSGSVDDFHIRLYAFVNLLDKVGMEKTLPKFYSLYRQWEMTKTLEEKQDAGINILVQGMSEASGYNCVPYFERWSKDIDGGIKKAVANSDYPAVYYLRDLVSTDEKAEEIRNDLNLAGIYSLVTNKDVKKYNLTGKLVIDASQIDGAFLNDTVYIKSGSEVVKKIDKLDAKTYTFDNLPIGVYEIEFADKTTSLDNNFVVIVENETYTTDLKGNRICGIRIDEDWGALKLGSELSGKLYLIYTSGDEAEIPLSELKDYEIVGFDKNKEGVQEFYIKYKGLESNKAKVNVRNFPKIKIMNYPSKLEYYIGEDLDLSGLVLEVETEEGKEILVENDIKQRSDIVISGYDKNKAGVQTITIKMKKSTQTFKVEVKGNTNNSENNNNNNQNDDNENTNNNNTNNNNSGKSDNVNNNTTNNETNENNFDTAKSESAKLKVYKAPSKLVYNKGESLDFTDGVLTYLKDDNLEVVRFTDPGVVISGYDSEKVGTQNLIITYKDLQASLTIEVKDVPAGGEVLADEDNSKIQGQTTVLNSSNEVNTANNQSGSSQTNGTTNQNGTVTTTVSYSKTKEVKTGDTILYSVGVLVIAGIVLVVVKRRKNNSNKGNKKKKD